MTVRRYFPAMIEQVDFLEFFKLLPKCGHNICARVDFDSMLHYMIRFLEEVLEAPTVLLRKLGHAYRTTVGKVGCGRVRRAAAGFSGLFLNCFLESLIGIRSAIIQNTNGGIVNENFT